MNQITVRLFASMKDAAGVDAIQVRASSVAEVARELSTRFPAAQRLLERSRFAVNQQFASADIKLNDGDEVAVLPPVSGG
jgi:molybdopterin converting factor subunit 1